MNMNPGISGACFALFLLGLAGPLATESTAAVALGPITVTVASGRTFTAEVDPRTDAHTLWLRWARSGAVIQQPISWDRVVEVLSEGRRATAAEFAQSLALQNREAVANAGRGQNTPIVIGSWADRHEKTAETPPPSAPPQQGRVQSLAIDVGLANWNNTAEIDGLAIEVSPLDATGTLTPVRGTLEVEMVGCASSNMRPGREFPVIGRWTQRVETDDFTTRSPRYHLAFQQVRPETERTLSPRATVRARLTVPGEGVFEAVATVRIRMAGPIGDRW